MVASFRGLFCSSSFLEAKIDAAMAFPKRCFQSLYGSKTCLPFLLCVELLVEFTTRDACNQSSPACRKSSKRRGTMPGSQIDDLMAHQKFNKSLYCRNLTQKNQNMVYLFDQVLVLRLFHISTIAGGQVGPPG